MTGASSPPSGPPNGRPPDDRLDSWKEIAGYMRRDVTTVQRWEKREGMPVHRHLHDKMGSVYAFKAELDAWARQRGPVPVASSEAEAPSIEPTEPNGAAPRAPGDVVSRRSRLHLAWLAIAVAVILATLTVWRLSLRDTIVETPLTDARFTPLTDFDGIEQAAAVSRDGKFVAYLSDRDGQMDVWVTPVGVGQFSNLTRGGVAELVNPSVRTLGFSPDGTLVTYWARQPTVTGPPAIGTWAVPVLGGEPRPYLDDVAEYDWTGDGARLVYHTPGPGDPMFVRDRGEPADSRQILLAPPGLHNHFLAWSPDRAFIYFVQGSLPDHLDLWRLKVGEPSPERITHHDALVSHPVFVSPRTVLYLAGDRDGGGPWIHSLDVASRQSQRVSFGIDRYTSLSASADGRRVVATIARPKSSLWRLPLAGPHADMSAAHRMPLMTGTGSAPRLGPGYVLYVSTRGSGDSLWKRHGDRSTELWSAPDARIVGGAAISRDGTRIALAVRQRGRTWLYAMDADGTNARPVTGALELEGSPAWAPGGDAITVGVVSEGGPRLFNVPLDGRAPAPLLEPHSVDPLWSPDGAIITFSGPEIGTTFEIRSATADGGDAGFGPLTLTRGARHVAFMPGRRSLIVLRGAIHHKNLWLVDLDSGAERPLTDFAPDFEVRDFDISPDGREIVIERVQEDSDLVLIERAR
jgi:Tol biopolymer transport system component